MEKVLIKSNNSLLKVGDKTIDRDFSFKVERHLNKTMVTLDLEINKKHAHQNNLSLALQDYCSVSIQNNSSSNITIFEGSIYRISENNQNILIKGIYHALENEIFEKTFLDSNTKNILNSFVPKMNFQANDTNNKQIILKGTKESSLQKMISLHKLNYFIDLNQDLIIIDDKARNSFRTFKIDNCVQSVTASSITIFPIPNLEIGDKILYKQQEYFISDLIYSFQRNNRMKIGVH